MEYQFNRIAVKIGSNVLTRKDGTLDVTRMSALVDQVAELHKNGVEVVLVSSPAAGASSYAVWDGGIEIQIDTRPDLRRRGLALSCGARLILTCLDQGLLPSWDAHDRRSAALAEKLGYRLDRPYPPIFWTRPVRKKIARFSYGSYHTFAGKTPSKVRPPLIP